METSRVLVTYNDSSHVYPSIARSLQERLPLRNLNWNTSSRPFRSIPSLHVELVHDGFTKGQPDSDRASDLEEKQEEVHSRRRRHQIPGLRQSPYLKINFVKCDDVDSYRATCRQQIREWISNLTPDSQSNVAVNQQNNHDAFEWLIVHVVPAAVDGSVAPGSTARNDGEGYKRASSLRWSSKSSTMSVIDKIRADFNGTSKSAVDRVVQITGQDENTGWDDMVAKMKSLILASFDKRVTQYEEDIKEKEMQQSLPGWNFNTFFVLKEGLARGFESVGLIDDALIGYHELSTGLSAILEDGYDASETTTQPAAPFVECTKDLAAEYAKSMDHTSRNGHEDDVKPIDFGSTILDTGRKDFRHMILANNISIFDFQCYVFARQVALLLRLANAGKNASVSSEQAHAAVNEEDLMKPSDAEPEDLAILAEICQLASTFIVSAVGRMREEITTSFMKLNREVSSMAIEVRHASVSDNLICSWIYSACQSVLNATSSRSLSAQLKPLLGRLQPSDHFGTYVDPNFNGSVPRKSKGLPDRTSSLPTGPTTELRSPTKDGFHSIATLDALRSLPPGTPHPGAQELAAQRGSLILLARRALDDASCQNKGWQGGVAAVEREIVHNGLRDVKLDDETHANMASPVISTQTGSSMGIRSSKMMSALESSTLAHFIIGNRTNAAEAMTADLAVARYRLKDHESAASYFDQLANFYHSRQWKHLELAMLDRHAQCLKHLGRIGDLMRVAMQAVAINISQCEPFMPPTLHLADIIELSGTLKSAVQMPMTPYLDSFKIKTCIQHSTLHDGFQTDFYLRNACSEAFVADSIEVKIVSTDVTQPGEVWLTAEGPQRIGPGSREFVLGAKTMRPAWYRLESIVIRARNICFVHDRSSKSTAGFFSDKRESMPSIKSNAMLDQHLLVWARTQGLNLRVKPSEAIDLRQPRSISIQIDCGLNRILSGKLSLRAASAGLRLDTAEAKQILPPRVRDDVSNGNTSRNKIAASPTMTSKDQPGIVIFGEIDTSDQLIIGVPYSLEDDLGEIHVKVEVAYKTEAGDFTLAQDCKLKVTLPVSVNVQDTFKTTDLYSRFTIGSATACPMRLFSCHIKGNEQYDASTAAILDEFVDVFPGQPLSFLARIRARHEEEEAKKVSRSLGRLLHLKIEYQCLDEEIFANLEASLKSALEAAKLEEFLRPLQNTLRIDAQRRYTPQDMEAACLVGKLSKGNYEESNWESVLSGFAINDRRQLAAVLKTWHEQPIDLLAETKMPQRLRKQYLTVPFDLPHVDFVHTAQLSRLPESNSPKEDSRTIGIDHPIPMQLSISHTRQWAVRQNSRGIPETVDFEYELQANPDTWLIGGQRKARLTAKEGENQTFAVILVPQRTGMLLYPSIQITPSTVGHGSMTPSGQGEDHTGEYSSETDYLSQSDTFHVVSNLASTTVSLDPMSGGWLVESRSREPAIA